MPFGWVFFTICLGAPRVRCTPTEHTRGGPNQLEMELTAARGLFYRSFSRYSSCAATREAVYQARAVQFHPRGGQSDFVWLPARTPHGCASYVW